MRRINHVLSVSRSLSTLLLFAALGACAKHESSDGAAPAIMASAAPSTPVKSLELTPTGQLDPNKGYPTFNIKNTGQKAIVSYSVQVVVNNKAGEKIASESSTMSPYNPIKPGATLTDVALGVPEMKAPDTKADFHLYDIQFDDSTSWHDASAVDERPKVASASTASASAATPAAKTAPPSKLAAPPPARLATKK